MAIFSPAYPCSVRMLRNLFQAHTASFTSTRLTDRICRPLSTRSPASNSAKKPSSPSPKAVRDSLAELSSSSQPKPHNDTPVRSRSRHEAYTMAAESPIRSTPATHSQHSQHSSPITPTSRPSFPKRRPVEPWKIQKAALEAKFKSEPWMPRKRISPDALQGIRALRASDPETYNTATLAEHFKISPEAVRRILKSKWTPNEDEAESRRRRWEKRGEGKWNEMVQLGVRPPKKWRDMGVGKVIGDDGKTKAPIWKRKQVHSSTYGQPSRTSTSQPSPFANIAAAMTNETATPAMQSYKGRSKDLADRIR